MEYTVNKLGKIAGVSTRTLRYYDEINLLKPCRVNTSGYRIYGQREVDLLQQILFYRELGVSLEDIRNIVTAPSFDGVKALQEHLCALRAKREQLDQLVATVEKTILLTRGEKIMTDIEKFEGFKQKLIEDNEKQYGAEIRAKYGNEVVDRSNEKIKNMSKAQSEAIEKLTAEFNKTLKAAFETGDPASEEAQKACRLHKESLCFYWQTYSKEAHIGLAQMYVDDPRFTAYYDQIAVGCAPFLLEAIKIFCTKE